MQHANSSSPASFRNASSRNNSSHNLENVASFAPPNSVQRSNSRSNSKLINQKDKIIEDLRLELAEYQVKMLEVENAGGGRLRELEKQLLETRMTNARLMEDNESFQLLLGEKTLNGDLSRGDVGHEGVNGGVGVWVGDVAVVVELSLESSRTPSRLWDISFGAEDII